MNRAIDIDKATELLGEASALDAAGKMTEAEFRRLYRDLMKALGPDGGEWMEGLLLFAQDDSWIPNADEPETPPAAG